MPISLRERSEMGELVGKPGETLSETLRRTLLEMVLFGYFEDGARLYPEQIAERFKVSLTPVREALMQLAAQGFIEAVQRRGYHVRKPDAKHLKDLWQVRLAIELMAGEQVINRLVAGELDPTAIEGLDAIQDQLDAAPRNATHTQKLEMNGSFHHLLVDLSGNELLISTFRSIQLRVLSAWVQRGLEDWRTRNAGEAVEHRRIISALRDMDHAACQAAIRAHLARSLKDALHDLAALGGREEEADA